MYPQRELTRLALRKAELRRDIALNRLQCVAAAGRVAQPLAWLDRMVAFCQKISPFMLVAAVPLALFAKRKVLPRLNMLGLLLRWGPLVFGMAQNKNASAGNRKV